MPACSFRGRHWCRQTSPTHPLARMCMLQHFARLRARKPTTSKQCTPSNQTASGALLASLSRRSIPRTQMQSPAKFSSPRTKWPQSAMSTFASLHALTTPQRSHPLFAMQLDSTTVYHLSCTTSHSKPRPSLCLLQLQPSDILSTSVPTRSPIVLSSTPTPLQTPSPPLATKRPRVLKTAKKSLCGTETPTRKRRPIHLCRSPACMRLVNIREKRLCMARASSVAHACYTRPNTYTRTRKQPLHCKGKNQTQKNTPQGKTHLALLHQILARIKYPAVHDDSVLRVGGPTANPHDSNAHFRTLALAHTHTQKKTCPHPKPTHDIASTFFIRCTPRLKRSLPLCPFFVACFRHCRSCALVSAF